MGVLRPIRVGLLFFAVSAVAACNSSTPSGGPVNSEVASGTPSRPVGVTIEVVKLPDLERAIAAHKGSVVVLDVWADY